MATARKRSQRQVDTFEAEAALSKLKGVQSAFGALETANATRSREVLAFPIITALKDCIDSLVAKMKAEAAGTPADPHHHGQGTPDYAATVDRVDAFSRAMKWPAIRLRPLVLSKNPLNIVDAVKGVEDAEAAKKAAKSSPAAAAP